MLKITKSITVTGSSVIEGTAAMYLNGNVSEKGAVTITKTINNYAAYSANKTVCNEDYEAFEAEMERLASDSEQSN